MDLQKTRPALGAVTAANIAVAIVVARKTAKAVEKVGAVTVMGTARGVEWVADPAVGTAKAGAPDAVAACSAPAI